MSTASSLPVRKAAVLGAGVMGAQIAAHLVNANVPVLLFDLPPRTAIPTATCSRRSTICKKLEPSPLGDALPATAHIEAANYDQHLPRLAECDLVIEAIAERMDWKRALYDKVVPHLGDRMPCSPAIRPVCRSTRWRKHCRRALRGRFCGVHFFNPPRYMHLVELIPCARNASRAARSIGKLS